MTTNIITPDTEILYNSSCVNIPTKVCKECRTIKYITEFYKDKKSHDGYQSQCKNCRSNIQKEYYRGISKSFQN